MEFTADTLMGAVEAMAVVGTGLFAIFKGGRWVGEVRSELRGIRTAVEAQGVKIEDNRKSIVMVHRRVDALVDRTVTPPPVKT